MHTRTHHGLLLLLLVSACSSPRGEGVASPDSTNVGGDTTDADAPTSDVSNETDVVTTLPEPLGPLPQQPGEPPHAGVFMGVEECAFCHTAGTGVLRDSQGNDVSPVGLWGASMMAFSARDPYWLAQLSHELAETPAAEDEIMDTCTRCHAPAANEIARREGGAMTFERLVTGTTPEDHIGREGVTCTVCHQITDEGLGTPESFVGEFVIGDDREIFGPHAEPFTNPMLAHVDYTPTEAEHVMESALCASCHTVITDTLTPDGVATGDRFPEQVPYLEWLNSDAHEEGVSCQQCHASRQDPGGGEVSTILTMRPPWYDTERPVGRHDFLGGNGYMLELLAANRDWAGITVPVSDIVDAVLRTEEFLQTTISMRLSSDAGELFVQVLNRAGHKFPTAYPTRRAWLEVVARDAAGATVFHSGGYDDDGRILAGDGSLVGSPSPHYAVVEHDSQVQIYEGVMAGVDGLPTHTLLRAAQWWKDNRLLPSGWRADGPEAEWTTPVGVDEDDDFGPGGDEVRYLLPDSADSVTVSLWYQTLPPSSLDAFAADPTPASVRLAQMVEGTPAVPRLVAEAELQF